MTDFYATSVPIGGNQNPMLTNTKMTLSLYFPVAFHSGNHHWAHHHCANHTWR